ncbi:MAG: AraC family transcriptional regulator [Flavobacteriaceae bacterium]|nr:AraC family transcriptional regulator [Flavobacteriaceae bacterium]
MKSKLEEIAPPAGSSFSVSLNPKMSDLFFWHFHPEFELVFIKGADNNRHVGSHLSRFKNSDLVLIGSFIPHLNFDYGLKGDYEKIVIHIRPDFLEKEHIRTPEFENISEILKFSQHGIAFGERTKNLMAERLFNLPNLSNFDQFLELLRILNDLMKSNDKELLHDQPVKNQYTLKDHLRLKTIYQFIDSHYQEKISVNQIGGLVHLSDASFCRYFKKMTKLTFTTFVNHYRIEKAKKLLLMDKNVTETCYSCGFGSLSYFNRIFKKIIGMNPQAFKKAHLV